jgi:hypothetical protein
MSQQAFHPAQRLGQREALQALEEPGDGRQPAGEFEAHDRAESGLLPRCQGMPRMRREARVVDGRYRVMPGQQVRNGGGVLTVLAKPYVQRPQAPERQEGIECTPCYAQAVTPPRQLLVQALVAGYHRATHDVAMAVDVLRGRVHDHVGTETDGLLPPRTHEGIVDGDQRAGGVRGFRYRRDVGDPQQRVARRLDPHDAWPGRQGARHGGRIGHVHEIDLGTPGPLQGRKQAVGATVAVVGCHDPFPWLSQRDAEAYRRHSRGRYDRPGTALQIGQRPGQRIPGRVAGPGIVVLAPLVQSREGECRRQVDRRHHGAVLGIGFQPGPDRACLLTKFFAHRVSPSSAQANAGSSCFLSLRNAS